MIWYIRGMAKNTSYVLTDPQAAFIDARIAEGRAQSASEIVRTAIDQYIYAERLTEHLKTLLIGRRIGPFVPHDEAWSAFEARMDALDLGDKR